MSERAPARRRAPAAAVEVKPRLGCARCRRSLVPVAPLPAWMTSTPYARKPVCMHCFRALTRADVETQAEFQAEIDKGVPAP